MKKVILVAIMSFGVVGNLVAMEPEKPQVQKEAGATVKIQTSDDQEFEIPLTLAKQIPTIKNLLEDIGESEEAIPLPNVGGKEFDRIIQILGLLEIDPEAQANLDGLSVDELINLANACEYLGISHVQMQVVKKLVELSSGNNVVFNKIFSQLKYESRTLLWRQYPAYRYFFSPHLIKTLDFIPVDHISINSDGNMLAIASYRFRTIKVFDMNDLDQKPRELFPNVNLGLATEYSDSGKLISVAEWGKTTKIWDTRNPNKEPYVLNEQYNFLAVSPDGKKLILASEPRRTIKIWNLENLDQKPRELQGEDVDNVIMSSDGKILISRYKDTIKIWDMDKLYQKPHTLNYKGLSFVASAGSKLIAWSQDYGTIKIWNINNLHQVFYELQHEVVNRVVVSPDGSKLISSSKDGAIKVWDINNPDKLLRELYDNTINGFSITHDRMILSSGMRGRVQVWDLNDLDKAPYESHTESRKSVDGIITSLDGSKLISWTSSSISIWDLIGHQDLDNLNTDQIMLMRWLYDNRNELVSAESTLTISLEQKKIYQTLSDRLKNFLQKLFPRKLQS